LSPGKNVVSRNVSFLALDITEMVNETLSYFMVGMLYTFPHGLDYTVLEKESPIGRLRRSGLLLDTLFGFTLGVGFSDLNLQHLLEVVLTLFVFPCILGKVNDIVANVGVNLSFFYHKISNFKFSVLLYYKYRAKLSNRVKKVVKKFQHGIHSPYTTNTVPNLT
jgi:hypothetical protein